MNQFSLSKLHLSPPLTLASGLAVRWRLRSDVVFRLEWVAPKDRGRVRFRDATREANAQVQALAGAQVHRPTEATRLTIRAEAEAEEEEDGEEEREAAMEDASSGRTRRLPRRAKVA